MYTDKIDQAKKSMLNNFIAMNISCESKMPLKSFMNGVEEELIKTALLVTNGNQRQAAGILGVKPTSLFEKIKKYNITPSKDIQMQLTYLSRLELSQNAG